MQFTFEILQKEWYRLGPIKGKCCCSCEPMGMQETKRDYDMNNVKKLEGFLYLFMFIPCMIYQTQKSSRI